MAFDNKFYPNRKDWIAPYKGVRRWGNYTRGCRPNSSCDYCRRDRLIGWKRLEEALKLQDDTTLPPAIRSLRAYR